VHVTHDLEEAMMLADRIRVMRAGRIVQSGTPAEIYYRPVDAFVAGFIGDTNLLPVRIERRGDTVRFESPAVACAEPVVPVEQTSPDLPDTHGLLMIRPELVRLLGPEEEAPPCTVEGRVGEFFIKGASIQYRIDVDGLGPPMIVEVPGTSRLPADVGQPVRLGFRRADVFLLRE
jgi:ABC-type Fe3+/spermidine/putrescine transport system ATPase subunit